MAFTVTPTSGDAPYTLSAAIDNAFNVDGVNYVASVMYYNNTGSCSVSGTGTALNPTAVKTLVDSGSVVLNTSTIPDGNCRTLVLEITRMIDNVVISSSSASIDNV